MSSKSHDTDANIGFVPEGFGTLSTEWELAELELELMDVADKLDPRALKALQLWMTGHTHGESVMLAGYNQKNLSDASKHFLHIARRDNAKKYIDLCKRISMMRALKEESFTEITWLKEVRDLLQVAKGHEKQAMATFYNGELIEGDGKQTQLTQALKALELIAKRHGWLTEKVETKQENNVSVSVKDFTRSAGDADSDDQDGWDD